jgi:cytochrome P450
LTQPDSAAARDEAYSAPLFALDMSDGARFKAGTFGAFFARLRAEAPVHYCPNSLFGPYWSIVRYDDIVQAETRHQVFSSEGGITLMEPPSADLRAPMFISMDPPQHTEQRRAISPILATENLANIEQLIRSRTISVIEDLPVNETFDWVERVSIELTTQMLATLFDFPFEDRKLLTHWSNVATGTPKTPSEWEYREAEFQKCLAYFTRLWNERVNAAPKFDLVSMMAHAPATCTMSPREYLGNLILLIVGGNDTTRNSMTGGVYFLNRFPDEYGKLRRARALIPSMVSEIIRYQTPLAYMCRRTRTDVELYGKTIRKGEKVALWYVSGNRDGMAIPDADRFWIDRPHVRRHLSFGYGIHRCVGNRLAELQLKILWEELMQRYPRIDVVGPPVRLASSFTNGYVSLPVKISR